MGPVPTPALETLDVPLPADPPWPLAESPVPVLPPDTGDPVPEAPALFVDGVIYDVYLELDEAARASLAVAPDIDVHASMTVDDGATLDVGLHLKGTSSFRTLDQKAAFKIDVHEFHPDARFRGTKRLTLNNMVQDGTMLHEELYYWLAGQLGVPAPRHGLARVWVDGVHYGLYGLVEAMDEQFIEHRWPMDPEGNLYEGSGDDFTDLLNHFELKETGVGPDVDALVATIISTPDEQFTAMLVDNFDIEALIGYWALDIVAGNGDGYAFNNHNYFLYSAPLATEWTMTPWGPDRAFTKEDAEVHGSLLRPLEGVLTVRCLAVPTCREALDARIREVADAFDSLDVLAFVEERYEVIGPLCEADSRREKECEVDDLTEFLETRSDVIRAQLDDL